MSNILVFRDIVDGDTGEYLHTNLENREVARKYKRQLKKDGYKNPKILRAEYKLTKETFER